MSKHSIRSILIYWLPSQNWRFPCRDQPFSANSFSKQLQEERWLSSAEVAHVNCSWIQSLGDETGPGFNVKEAQQTLSAIPLIVVVNICFSLCYNSMNNAFPSQACQMDVRLGLSQLNGAFYNVSDALAIVIFTPIFESCLFPVIGRLKGSRVGHGQKIIAGLIIASLSNISAAILEYKRKAAPFLCGDAGFSQCAPGYTEDGLQGTRMRDISAFWIFLPFTLVGISEILVNPCMYCYCYESAPAQVRSLLQAFNLFFSGSVSNAFTAVVSKLLYPNDLDSGNLESYYFANAAAAVLGIALYFLVTCSRPRSKPLKPSHSSQVNELDGICCQASGSDAVESGKLWKC